MIEEDRDAVEEERVPSALAVNRDAEVQPCPAGEGILHASFEDGLVVPPQVEGVETWEVRALAVFGQQRAEWTEEVGRESFVPRLPDEAYMDGHQREWVTALRLRLIGRGAGGENVEIVDADEIWFVLPQGTVAEPVWLDAEAKTETAPMGAWSAAVRATLAELEGGDTRITVEPPQGGAK